MKRIITLLLILFCNTIYAQRIVYVTDKNDKRLIAYQDSLRLWQENENWKKTVIKKLDEAPNLTTYKRVCKELGFADCTDEPTTADKKLMWDSKKKNKITYELITCFHSVGGDISCCYNTIVPKPKVKVIYIAPKPKIELEPIPIVKRKTTLYITIDEKGDTIKNQSITTVLKQ